MDDVELGRRAARIMEHLRVLAVQITDRSVGSDGNSRAAAYVRAFLERHGWDTSLQRFDVIDWRAGDATLIGPGGSVFRLFPSPYALGCDVRAGLVAVSTAERLRVADAAGSILLLHGDIAREPLTPKRYPFYTLDGHQRVVAGLEGSGARAVISAVPGRGVSLPVHMIEDGDFEIPAVGMTRAEGVRLLRHVGRPLSLVSESERVPAVAYNVLGRINTSGRPRVVVSAHLDAKKGSPGALDNAAGVATLLALCEILHGLSGSCGVELAVLNGEDHYAAPGQMAYLNANRDVFDRIALNINLDGVGYTEGDTAYSFFGLPPAIEERAAAEFFRRPGARAGIQWLQGDHGMFIRAGCPAIAVTSQWLLDNLATQSVTHTPRDRIDCVDARKLALCADSVAWLIRAITRPAFCQPDGLC